MTTKPTSFPAFLFTTLLIFSFQAVSADSTLTMNPPSYKGWDWIFVPWPRTDDLELTGGGSSTALLLNRNAPSNNPEPIRQRTIPYTAGGAYMDKNGVIYVDDLFNTPGQPPNTKTPVMRVIGGQIVDY